MHYHIEILDLVKIPPNIDFSDNLYFNLLKLSKKFDDKIIKAIEDEALVSMHPS